MLFRRLPVIVTLFSFLVMPCIMLGALKSMSGSWGSKQPYRVWTDNTGKFSAKAKLKTDRGNAIVLERKDGRIVTVPLRRLSSADQAFLVGAEEEEELFRLSFWKWNYSDPGDLWATFVNITPMWVTLVIPLAVTGFGILLYSQRSV